MIALLYSLLRQMIELLLPRFETTTDLSEQRFRGLDGSMDSWQDALSVFQDLLSLMPSTVFCVVDGIHWLDDRSTDTPLRELIDALRADKLRLLLTTSGRSGCLLEGLASAETLQIDSLGRGASFTLDGQGFDNFQ